MRNLEILTGVTRQMGTLLGSGIPLAETLKAMVEQADKRWTETMFREIRERINQGASLPTRSRTTRRCSASCT
jgi:type II secretory pathway component PulF